MESPHFYITTRRVTFKNITSVTVRSSLDNSYKRVFERTKPGESRRLREYTDVDGYKLLPGENISLHPNKKEGELFIDLLKIRPYGNKVEVVVFFYDEKSKQCTEKKK